MGRAARLIVLGSGTVVPSATRDTSCYLVDDGAGTAFLIDLGPGALQRAARAGYDLDRLGAVLLTHVHPDHCIDLATLHFALRNPLPRREQGPLAVFGHPLTAGVVERLKAVWPRWLEVGDDRLVLHPVLPGPVPVPGGTRVEAFPIEHTESSLGYRLTLPNGFQVAFSGDATEGGGLVDLGRDSDLLVLEAAVSDEWPVEGHLTPRRAGRVAAQCGTGHLLLTHFYPPVEAVPIADQAREAFEGPVTLAQDGMVVPLTRGD